MIILKADGRPINFNIQFTVQRDIGGAYVIVTQGLQKVLRH